MRGVIHHEKRLCNFSSSLTERSVPLDIISSCVASLINQVLLIKPRDYKWGAVAPSDITELEHIMEKTKKKVVFFFFSITEKLELPRHLRALRSQKCGSRLHQN